MNAWRYLIDQIGRERPRMGAPSPGEGGHGMPTGFRPMQTGGPQAPMQTDGGGIHGQQISQPMQTGGPMQPQQAAFPMTTGGPNQPSGLGQYMQTGGPGQMGQAPQRWNTGGGMQPQRMGDGSHLRNMWQQAQNWDRRPSWGFGWSDWR